MLDQLPLFLGRFHLVVLHIPIGSLLALAVVEVYAARRPSAGLSAAAWLLALVGCASAIVTVVLGIFLSWGSSYDPDVLFRHKWFGIATAALSVALVALRGEMRRGAVPQTRRLYQGVLAACMVTLVAGGHNGGTLTHGRGFLTRYAPIGMASAEADPATTAGGMGPYEETVEPMLEAHCLECHGPEKQENGLRLDERASILQGGESGKPAAVPGDAMASEMVRRLTLPRSHEEAMPPEGHQRPNAEQIMALIAWINAGAPLGDAMGRLAEGLEPVPTARLDELRAVQVEVNRLSEHQVLLDVSLAFTGDSAGSEPVLRLDDIAPNVTWLDLSGRTLSDGEWSAVAGFDRLTRLDLAHTNVADRHLVEVGGLAHLTYLNLYDTAVTDEGLVHLERLEALESVYLSGTATTPEGVARLAAALPSATIHLDSSSPAVE